MNHQDDTGLTTSRHTEGVLPQCVSEAMQDSSSKRGQAKSIASAKELRSRSASIVAPESWRTENRREPVSSQGEHPEKGGTVAGNTATLPSVEDVCTKQQRIAKHAQQMQGKALTSLQHHIDGAWLLEAWRRTRQDGAAGVDGQSAKQYAENLHGNLADLLNRFKSGSYRAPPVRRVHIPKGDGTSTRPIGIPTIEDKVLQRAVTMLLEPIYEAEFKDYSFGFRPGKSAHGALEHLWKQSMGARGERPVQWILDVDIRAFFDTLEHTHLRQMLDTRIRDGVIRRVIDKWLKAGVMEQGRLSYQEEGTPQGGVISPLLSNIYLHEVLDDWFEREVRPRMKGRVFLVRYADDFVIGFECEEDAKRVQKVLPKRFERYGLTLHPEKTRLLAFKPAEMKAQPQKEGSNTDNDNEPPAQGPRHESRSFDFLGFTHYWGRSRKGKPVIQRSTASKRLSRALVKLREWMRQHRHDPVSEQWRSLKRKVQGHNSYYGITGNSRGIGSFSHHAQDAWFEWLNRRGGKKSLSWEKYSQWLREVFRWPAPRIHPRTRVA